MALIQPINPETVSREINRRLDLCIQPMDMSLELRDWRWMARLQDRIIIVAPKAEAVERLAREREVLRLLGERVSFAVPRPEILEADSPLDVRSLVPGLTGSALHDEALRDPIVGEALAVRMGDMLAELHSAFSASKAEQLGNHLRCLPFPVDKLRRNLRGVVSPSLETSMYRPHSALPRSYGDVVSGLAS